MIYEFIVVYIFGIVVFRSISNDQTIKFIKNSFSCWEKWHSHFINALHFKTFSSIYLVGIFPNLSLVNWNQAGQTRARFSQLNRKWNGNVEYVETQFIPFFLSHENKRNKTWTRIRLQLKAPCTQWTKFIFSRSLSLSSFQQHFRMLYTYPVYRIYFGYFARIGWKSALCMCVCVCIVVFV